ncbi:MAG: DUF5063 domain-containing protein [Pyrinomonadaceae bacterium]
MTCDEIRSAISDYLSLIEGKIESHDEREKSLILALDRLALAYHFSESNFDEKDYPDAPRGDYETLYHTSGDVFPNYGYYNVVADVSVNIAETSVLVGDAIDDLADIALDMFEVIWLWENTSTENALWQFRGGYENHWGEHLRNLQLYIKANSDAV